MITFLQPDFIHEDARGSLHQLVSKGWSQVNVIRSEAGTVRGNHWHEINRELFFCISGSFRLFLQNGNDCENHEISQGAFFVIEPKVRHTFHYKEDTVIVALYDHGIERSNGVLDIHNS